jgi:hypothetical protein
MVQLDPKRLTGWPAVSGARSADEGYADILRGAGSVLIAGNNDIDKSAVLRAIAIGSAARRRNGYDFFY